VPKLTVEVELSERLHLAYQHEADRTGKKIEELVAILVNALIREMEREATDPPVLIS
jgi:hypothetical protein